MSVTRLVPSIPVRPHRAGTLLHSFTSRALIAAGLALLPAARGAHAGLPTRAPIVVDGDFDDWRSVLVNPENVTRDGDGSLPDCAYSRDRDCSVQSQGRDLRLFAWTYDSTHVYVHAVRQGSSSNTETFWFYADSNADGRMGSTERVLRVRFHGSSGDTTSTLYRYEAVDPLGDPSTDVAGVADGYTLPGNLDPGALWTEDEPEGGSPAGLAFEARVPWSVLGVPPGTPIAFHVASSNGSNPSNLASQVDDNLGRLGGGGGTFGYAQVGIDPDRSSTIAGGRSAAYAHVVTNQGTVTGRFALELRSTLGLRTSLYSDPDGDGNGDTLLAVDATGNGVFTDTQDFLDPSWDVDSDGKPETLPLAGGESFPIVVVVHSLASQQDAVDETSVRTWALAGGASLDSATDRTAIGPITLLWSRARGSVPGQSVTYAVSACNNADADVFDFAATSSLGLRVRLRSDAPCSGLPGPVLADDVDGDGAWDSVAGGDSDGDGLPDTGTLATGSCACFILEVNAGAGMGTDRTALVARASNDTTSAHVDLVTRIAQAVEVDPDHLIADGTSKVAGIARPVFFGHVVRNNGPAADRIQLSAANDRGWSTRIWSDPDGDGSISDGRRITQTDVVDANGGTFAFVVEVLTPEDAAPGITSSTSVIGRSSNDVRALDASIDQLEVSLVATYEDPLFTQATSFFAPCDTIYVEGTGLRRQHGGGVEIYSLAYLDGEGRLSRFQDAFVTDEYGAATDEIVLGGGDAAGSWRIELRDGEELLSTVETEVEPRGELPTVTTDRSSYPLAGADLVVSSTLRNGNVLADFSGSVLETVVLDATRSRYLVPGTTSTFRPYTGSELTRTTTVPPLAVDATFDDVMPASAVTYPGEGVYFVKLTWRAACGTELASRTVPFVAGSLAEDCTNGLDDDGDGDVDCLDAECALQPTCRELDCTNGLDDDGDGDVDCADSDCAGATVACPELDCDDNVDNELDGLTDCADPDCFADPACHETQCRNGVDDDLDGAVDCDDLDCAGSPNCLPESECGNGLDDDDDTQVDCDDIDCVLSPLCADADTDGDGVPNDDDCSPLDPGAHHVPEDVVLVVTKTAPGSTRAIVAWEDRSISAGAATLYAIASGRIGEMWQDRGLSDGDGDGYHAGCVESGHAGTSWTDARRTNASDGLYYLVNAHDACGDGGWGADSLGRERGNGVDPCSF